MHLYTPHRGRVSAIAKGVRKAKSRFGGRLEPFFRIDGVFHEGRSDLLTVTSATTVAAFPRLREHGAAIDAAGTRTRAVSVSLAARPAARRPGPTAWDGTARTGVLVVVVAIGLSCRRRCR